MIKLTSMILILLLISCRMANFSNNICPDIVEYTKEEQSKLINILQNNNNILLNRFIIDYYNLREKVRICKGK